MLHASAVQCCGVWGELVEAYHGVNGFGSSTAEIYAYRFMPRCPGIEADLRIMDGEKRRRELQAARDLVSICEEFERSYLDAEIYVNYERRIGPWFVGYAFDWRVRLTVRRGPRREEP